MELEEIIAKIRSGEVTKEEMSSFLDEITRFATNGTAKNSSLSAADQQSILDEALGLVKNSPEMQKLQREVIADKRATRIGKRYAPFFNAIMAGADLASSVSQVRNSNRAINSLVRPEAPTIPGIDPALDNAIRGAEVGTMDAARAVAPARQAIQDGFNQDLAQASIIGQGQASTTGALGQVAALRRNRAIGNLSPQIDSIRAREQSRLDSLIGRRMSQNNQNFQNRFRQHQLDLGQFNLDSQAAGNLGSVGRLNRRNAINSLVSAAPGVIARVNPRGFGDKFSDYEMQLNNNLTGNRAGIFNESDIYGSQGIQGDTVALNNENQYRPFPIPSNVPNFFN